MLKKWIQSLCIIAVLLISMISISSAAVPTAKTDLYTGAKCGVDFSVSTPGILGNDLKPTGPLTVKAISQFSGPGNITVNPDGSFVYHPPQSIPAGTYVTFYYTATDGKTISNSALVKITVSCVCHGAAPDVSVCLGTAITADFLKSKGAGCVGCRDATPKFDLSKIPAQPIAGQCYPYNVSCPGCNMVTGHVCFQAPCEISFIDFPIPTDSCPGHDLPTAEQIIDLGAVSCGPCDGTPVISDIKWTSKPPAPDDWVGQYTITCKSSSGCEASETGTFTSKACLDACLNEDGTEKVCTASDQCHIAGTCDPSTGVCSNPIATNDTSCNDGNACTETDTCQAGVCTGTNPVACTAADQCHTSGTCDPATGTCSNPVATDETPCNDGNKCTETDTCQAGVCTGEDPVECSPSDQCHIAGTCDPATGTCNNPAAENGATCDDGNKCTADRYLSSGCLHRRESSSLYSI